MVQIHSWCSPGSPFPQDDQHVPDHPDYYHGPQSHDAGGPIDATDAGYGLDNNEKTAAFRNHKEPYNFNWTFSSQTSISQEVMFCLLIFFPYSMLCFHLGNMRGFRMGGQQFRQFFTAGSRSSLLGPVPMGMAIKSPMMRFPASRQYHQHGRYYNNNNHHNHHNNININTASVSTSSSSITSAVITTAILYS